MDQAQENRRQVPEMEKVNCILCGSDKPEYLYTLEDLHTRQPGQFTLVRCTQCQLVYLDPRPTLGDISTYYPSSYEPHMPLLPKDLPWLRRWLVQYGLWKRCQPLLQNRSSGRILDIGCGLGHFLATMKQYGNWETVGIDLNSKAIAFAREVLHLEAYSGRIDDIKFPQDSFDAVTMWDVLEHLHDPRSTLLEVRRILKPQGCLLVRVPSLDSLDARLFGPFWAGLDAPRHLIVFSRKTLMRLLVETGFSIERLWCMSGSHASFVLSLRFLLSRRNSAGWPSNLLYQVIASPLGSVLSMPYFSLINKLTLSPEVTALARKRAKDG